LRAVIAAKGFDTRAIGIDREEVAAPFEENAPVAKNVVGQIAARYVSKDVGNSSIRGGYLYRRPGRRDSGVDDSSVGQVERANAILPASHQAMRYSIDEIDFPNLPVIVPGRAAGEEDATGIVGDGGVGRRQKSR
jgi:hypothetical protein